VACGGNSEGDSALQPAAPVSLTAATFAGRTSNANLFAAVVTHATGIEVYFCDGQRDYWFRGAPGDSILEMVDSNGVKLLLSLGQDVVLGRLVEGSTVTPFELPRVQGEALYRGETYLGDQRILGGWIKLPDGEQRGVIRVGSTSLTSTLTADRFTCDNCQVFAGSLIPAALTPASAQRTVNQLQKFTVIGLGDSFMSGEGAPLVEGRFTDGGNLGTSETWASGLPFGGTSHVFRTTAAEAATLQREALACHRGDSGLGQAVRALQTQWQRVELIHQTFACSGAKIGNLIDTFSSGYAGCGSLTSEFKKFRCLEIADDLPTDAIRPQFPAALDFLSAERLSADAVVMSIGGNDLGFGPIIEDCLGGDCWKEDSASQATLKAALVPITPGVEARLPALYTALAGTFTSARLPAGNVFLTQHPNPLRNTAGDLCAGLDFADPLLRLLSDEDAVFATSVHGMVNEQVRLATAAKGWKMISSHVGTEIGHGLCTQAPWWNDTTTALITQGHDLPDNSLFIGSLSAGMVHPNKRGQREAYKPAYQAALNAMLLTRFKPKTPTRVKPVRFATQNGRGVVTLQWDDINSFESHSVIRNAVGGTLVTVGADSVQVTVTLAALSGALTVKACHGGPTDVCSAESATVNVDVKVPTHMPNITVSGGSSINQATPEIPIAWTDLAPTRMYSTLELDANGIISRSAVEGQKTVLPVGTTATRFRVAACNTLGCGPATAWTTLQKPPLNLIPLCVPPQKPLLNGCR